MSLFSQRRIRFIEQMSKEGIEGALILNPSSIYYLTGFYTNPHERFVGLFLFSDGQEALVVPHLEKEAASPFIDDLLSYSDSDQPAQFIGKIIGHYKGERFGVEKDVINLERAEWIKEIIPGIKFQSINHIIHQMRSRKSPEELQLLREAARIVDEVVQQGVKNLRKGMTEIQLAGELERLAKELGASKMSFDTTVLSGPKSALPHGKPDQSPILENEYLLLDLGVMYKGYCSDITRTFMVGEGTEKHKLIYETVLEAEEKAITGVQPGVTYSSLDKIARDIITNKGYGQYFTHRLGHGLGLEVHEFPSVHGENYDILETGVVFTIEPGIYVPHFGGVRIEDDVVVTEDGVEVLTKTSKDWASSIIFFA